MWHVQSPDGRKFNLRAQPVGVPEHPVPHGVMTVFWLLGWLWHWTLHKGWRVEITEELPLRRVLREWPGPTTWLMSELPTKMAAVEELHRLAGLIQEGTWCPPS